MVEMNVVGICGTPRENGNTKILLESALQETGEAFEMVELAKTEIKPCNGCMDCSKGRTCPIEDGMKPLYQKLAAADLIFVATPTYFSAPTAQTKAFMDRCLPFFFDKKLAGKIGASLIISASDGHEHNAAALREFFEQLGMFYAGSAHAKASEPRDVKRDLKGLREAAELAVKAKELRTLTKR
jgi:multimeric flavodoxin WrbA